MAISEFRYNHKVKHYTYIFKSRGEKRDFLTLTSHKYRRKTSNRGHTKYISNVELYQHPNPKKRFEKQYVIPKIKTGKVSDFDKKLKWNFHLFDKRKIKKIKNNKW